MGKVYLVGAGPGDIELLTIKALKLIKKADIIIYDKLVNPDILEEAKENCKFIYVGKSKDNHIVPQHKINELLFNYSLKYEYIIRLKGGDPFVFGRGAEEALYLYEKNIKFEIIPGVTSAISVPTYAGIPVTQRQISNSFRIITGHNSKNRSLSHIDWKSFSTNETIIFLMGLHNLSEIIKNLLQNNIPESFPIAVISKGTTKEQKVAIGTLKDIYNKTKQMPTPALIIIGKVVKQREYLRWFD